jgi:hypothetical protein
MRLHVIYALPTVGFAIALPFVELWLEAATLGPRSILGRFFLYWQLGRALTAVPYPFFLLVWFRRRRIRRQFRTWRRYPAAATARATGTVWPRALGAVSMLLGGKLLFGSLWSASYPVWNSLLQIQWPMSANAPSVIFHALGGALGGLLMVAGWLLWHRRRGAAVCHLIYAVAFVIATLGWPVLASSATLFWQGLSGLSRYYYLALMVGSGLLALAFPVFLLVWFLRPKIRAQVKSWSQLRG